MKKLSQILEQNNDSEWIVKSEVTLHLNAANEGEASFLADRILKQVNEKTDVVITEITKKENY